MRRLIARQRRGKHNHCLPPFQKRQKWEICGNARKKTGLNLCNKAERYSQKSRKSHKCHRSGDGSLQTSFNARISFISRVFNQDSRAEIFLYISRSNSARSNHSINKHHDWLVKTAKRRSSQKIGRLVGRIRRRDISCVGCQALPGQLPPGQRRSWPICNKYPHQRQIDTAYM